MNLEMHCEPPRGGGQRRERLANSGEAWPKGEQLGGGSHVDEQLAVLPAARRGRHVGE